MDYRIVLKTELKRGIDIIFPSMPIYFRLFASKIVTRDVQVTVE